MGINRASLRRKAKLVYKEKTKDVPKKQRITFAEFFKKFKTMKSDDIDNIDVHGDTEEDFNFEDMINTDEDTEENQ